MVTKVSNFSSFKFTVSALGLLLLAGGLACKPSAKERADAYALQLMGEKRDKEYRQSPGYLAKEKLVALFLERAKQAKTYDEVAYVLRNTNGEQFEESHGVAAKKWDDLYHKEILHSETPEQLKVVMEKYSPRQQSLLSCDLQRPSEDPLRSKH